MGYGLAEGFMLLREIVPGGTGLLLQREAHESRDTVFSSKADG